MRLDERIDLRAAAFRERCAQQNWWVSVDGRVSTATAALLLEIKQQTLEKMRPALKGPSYFKLPGCPITYQLRDIAAWIESNRVNPD